MPGIIKSGHPTPQLAGEHERPYFHLEDLERRGEQYLTHVRDQAADILRQAQMQAETQRQAAVQAARQESLVAVRKEMQQEIQRRLATLEPLMQAAVTQLQTEIQQWRREWETRTVGLAIEIARRICRREFQQQPELVLTQLEAALQLAATDDQIELRIHPQDLEAFEPLVQAILGKLGLISKTQLHADATVQMGGCVVRTRYGLIDAQLDTQLKRLEEELQS
jgi:flagellar assembly protein FliH